MCSKNGATLPKDMADIADAEGVRVVVMKDFLRYTTSGPLAGFLAWLFAKYPAVRDRALAGVSSRLHSRLEKQHVIAMQPNY